MLLAEVDKLKTETQSQQASVANTYLQMGALDSSEVRKTLKDTGSYELDDSLDSLLNQPAGGE